MLGRGGQALGWGRALALVAATLLACSAASAGTVPVPWSGGAGVISPFEATASGIASELTGHAVAVECHSATSWQTLSAALGVDPAKSWAVTPFHWDAARRGAAPDGVAHFSPRACKFGDAFFRAPAELGTRTCHVLLRRGKSKHAQPVGECDQWASKLTAVHVLSHESMHLSGLYGEANADCLGVQIDAYVAMALGADERFARSLAREFWSDYYAPRADAYRSDECHDGGSLDLFPGRSGWPAPKAYPADLGAAVAALAGRIRAAGGSP